MNISREKALALNRLRGLVAQYEKNKLDYSLKSFNETQTRTDFITPFLEIFGWDVHNRKGLPSHLREVIEEATVEVGEEHLSKKPDYELRLSNQRKLFIEAKKPSIKLDKETAPAFQIRRYGYSANLPISILTNFRQLAIYDCLPRPNDKDHPHVARLLFITYDEYESHFEELWDIFSRESVYSGSFDKRYKIGIAHQGKQQFDTLFLEQVRGWRFSLAQNIYKNTPKISQEELSFIVQKILSRIIFLRICEDRDIEKYENLRSLGKNRIRVFHKWMSLLQEADHFYDSGLFDLVSDSELSIKIDDEILLNIFEELYYPQSPYTFSVVESAVLGEVYELFLGEEIVIDQGIIHIQEKPEIQIAGGVIPTPRYIVDKIIDETLLNNPLSNSIPEHSFTILDPCCGSGIFLIACYERILSAYLAYYSSNRGKYIGNKIYESTNGELRLVFAEKRRILEKHIFGVDIDCNAIEVARLSLYIKLLENENLISLKAFVKLSSQRVLPSLNSNLRCGNSLISPEDLHAVYSSIPSDILENVKSFSWKKAFPFLQQAGGFDIIVENPPYVRIQNMKTYSPSEIKYLQNSRSPFATSKQDNFDKYALFIERSLSLLSPQGTLGAIIPNKFMNVQAGQALRKLYSEKNINTIIHFGTQQVFGKNYSNYTSIVVVSSQKQRNNHVKFEKVLSIDAWRYGENGTIQFIPQTEFSIQPWNFAQNDFKKIVNKIRKSSIQTLNKVADIFVGVQTSADKIFIIHPYSETTKFVFVTTKDNHQFRIEKEILRPSLLDVQIEPFVQPIHNSYMIFPYTICEKNGKKTASLLSPEIMQKKYPGCFAYLKHFKKELSRRNISGGVNGTKQFYQFGRSQSLTKFSESKIILPILSLEPRYAYDQNDIVVTGGGNGPYYLIRTKNKALVSDFFLLGLLNHPLSEALIRNHTSVFRGGYYSHGKLYISDIPIPHATSEEKKNIENIVAEICMKEFDLSNAKLLSKKVEIKTQIDIRKEELESIFNRLWHLTQDDISVIKGIPVPE